MKKQLTAKQKTFCAAFARENNATAAARAAGYSAGCASGMGAKLMKIPEVLHEIDLIKAAAARRSCRGVAEVLKDLQDLIRRAREKGDLKTELKALELEGKHYGAFVDRVEVSGAVDLVASIKKARARLGYIDNSDIIDAVPVEPVANRAVLDAPAVDSPPPIWLE